MKTDLVLYSDIPLRVLEDEEGAATTSAVREVLQGHLIFKKKRIESTFLHCTNSSKVLLPAILSSWGRDRLATATCFSPPSARRLSVITTKLRGVRRRDINVAVLEAKFMVPHLHLEAPGSQRNECPKLDIYHVSLHHVRIHPPRKP